MSLTKSQFGLLLVLAAIVLCPTVFLCVTCTKVFKPPEDECGYPPGPFYGNSVNVDLALKNTFAVFRGNADPKVIDVIPPEARTLEMIGYLSCKAQKSGLISTNEELREYTALLGNIARGNPIHRYVRHFGTLLSLQNHLRKSPEVNFSLVLDPSTPGLQKFWIDEITAKTWPRWFQKMCSQYAACLECEPAGENIKTQVIIRTTSDLREINIDGVIYLTCPN
jgi:hypothetical protein